MVLCIRCTTLTSESAVASSRQAPWPPETGMTWMAFPGFGTDWVATSNLDSYVKEFLYGNNMQIFESKLNSLSFLCVWESNKFSVPTLLGVSGSSIWLSSLEYEHSTQGFQIHVWVALRSGKKWNWTKQTHRFEIQPLSVFWLCHNFFFLKRGFILLK